MARRIVGFDEQDIHGAHGGFRRWYCWTQRSGATAKVKRRTNRRERREGKAQIAQALRDAD